MQHLTSADGTTVSYDVSGSGPPLVLVHGSFSDHVTNWEFVAPLLSRRFTLYTIARRGRGKTDATERHTLEEEGRDVADVVERVGEPVFLLGHSHGAHCALIAARMAPDRIRKLVLYEPIWPSAFAKDVVSRLSELAAADRWDAFAYTFFKDTLHVPVNELDLLRTTEIWPPIVADAKASFGDILAIVGHDFDAEVYRSFEFPVLLQIGTESPRDLYVTDALAAVLRNVRIGELPGQAHEGMTTAPEMYAAAVTSFLEE